MPIIRTPEERFVHLPDFPFRPHYAEVDGVRVHYLDEGSGEVILCLHGEPSWCYLYRKMIPLLSARHRVIAPDFIGFGRSDKYTELKDSYKSIWEALSHGAWENRVKINIIYIDVEQNNLRDRL